MWPTRLRGSFTLLKQKGVDSAKRLKKSCKKRIQHRAGTSASPKEETECANGSSDVITEMDDSCTQMSSDEGVDIDGDLFFDPLDDPLNESDDETSVEAVATTESCDRDWVPFDEPPMFDTANLQVTPQTDDANQDDLGASTPPQVLEEMPLPRMFIPGKIVHVYTHRGGYKAAFVPRKFRSLRRISMAGNMLSDHMTKTYYEGLLEVKDIRAAKQPLPQWVGFADDCTWCVFSCC